MAETPANFRRGRGVRRTWDENELRVVATMERLSSRRFVTAGWADTAITVHEAAANSGYRARPMRMRSSYPPAQKLATLVHELGHRLQTDLFARDEEAHEYLFLWLYECGSRCKGRRGPMRRWRLSASGVSDTSRPGMRRWR